MESSYAIGIDLGATKIASALVSSRGQIIVSRELRTDTPSGPAIVSEQIAQEIVSLTHQSPGKIAGVGIGSPGSIDPRAGIVKFAVNLGWQNVPLVREVRSFLPANLPVWLEKDTNAMALGETYFGSSQGIRDLVYFSVGSGLGAGIIANGQIVSGATGIAADIGHLSLDPGGRQCNCGLLGCAETVVSGPGLVNLAREWILQDRYPTCLDQSTCVEPPDILSAAFQGDTLALKAFERVGEWLGIVMAAAIMLLNPARVVIGGGLGLAAYDLLLPAARQEVNRRATLLTMEKLQFVPSTLASSAVGAACLVWGGSDIGNH